MSKISRTGGNQFHTLNTGDILATYTVTQYDREDESYYCEDYELHIRHMEDWVRGFVDYLRFCASPHHIESRIDFEDFDDNDINIQLRGPVRKNVYGELYFTPEYVKFNMYNDCGDFSVDVNNKLFVELINSILNDNEDIYNKFKEL